MAKPSTLKFSSFLVKLGDGAGTEIFSAPCGFTSKALNLSAASSNTTLPDCDDPEAAAWDAKAVSALSGQVQGSGVLALESLATWIAWFNSGASKNIQIILDDDDGGTFAGAAILTSLNLSAQLQQDGNRAQISVTIDNDGEWVWTPTA